jgi:hypothetical protein
MIATPEVTTKEMSPLYNARSLNGLLDTDPYLGVKVDDKFDFRGFCWVSAMVNAVSFLEFHRPHGNHASRAIDQNNIASKILNLACSPAERLGFTDPLVSPQDGGFLVGSLFPVPNERLNSLLDAEFDVTLEPIKTREQRGLTGIIIGSCKD